MTDDYLDTARLVLAKCAAADPWFPNPSDATVLMWAECFTPTGLSRADLLAAVTVVYSTHNGDIRPKPRDIIDAARIIRRDRSNQQQLQLERAREPLTEPGPGYTEYLQTYAKLFGIQHDRRPLRVRCSWCGAQPGSACKARGPGTLRMPSVFHQPRIDTERRLAAGESIDEGGIL
ncbi:zinc finger domain-containing protein [Mycolicibacterium porcinum]|uniref:zinc finger domain-containing protein n=1 Tax=Mycolicibacterium porcinum TaxID=39693 RepID=UPI000848BAF1|nr:hypothetical protein [Mycolicibacterium porcinum]ODR20792.1 hypothetical protein BHQ19_22140 [Mycolicibacterium porcinum]